MRLIFLIIVLITSQYLMAQGFLEDFEQNNLNDWEVISGIANLVDDPIVEGSRSVRLWDRETSVTPEAVIKHRTFNEDFGIYSYYARGDGPESDADFYFQYLDAKNYYYISHKAIGTENPEFIIVKVVDSVYTELYRQEAIEERGKWVYVRIQRTCNGRLVVEINSNEILDMIDTGIMKSGSMLLGSWNQYSYFDRIEFDPFIIPRQTISRTLCIGQEYVLGDSVYTSTGTYIDTVSGDSYCDSILQLELKIVNKLETNIDTVLCPGDTMELEGRIISTEGVYNLNTLNERGCDSIVYWNVSISPTFVIGPDLSFCEQEEIEILAGNQKSYVWSDGSMESSLFVNSEGVYGVEVVDVNNCIQKDSISVLKRCEIRIETPNIFSPNGDALQDVWRPTFEILPSTYSLTIYDRWGNVQFQAEDPYEAWDGGRGESKDGAQVYVWHIIADDQSFTGDFTLIR